MCPGVHSCWRSNLAQFLGVYFSLSYGKKHFNIIIDILSIYIVKIKRMQVSNVKHGISKKVLHLPRISLGS